MKALNTALIVMGIALVVIVAMPMDLGFDKSADKVMVTVPKRVPHSAPVVSNGPVVATTKGVEIVELTSANSVTFNQAFTDESVSQLMLELQALNDKSPKGHVVYLVLDSPGGSVPAGNRLISFIKGLNLRVKTLTLFSASMGFQTVQGLDERLILDTGTLMSHRAKFGLQGEAPGEFFTKLKWIMAMLDRMDQTAADRMGMTFAAYRELVRDEYWVNGWEAVADKAADRVVYAKCGAGLSGTKQVEVDTMFGAYVVTLSACPLIPGILDAKPKQGEAKAEALKYVKALMGNKAAFVNEYIVTNKWMNFQK